MSSFLRWVRERGIGDAVTANPLKLTCLPVETMGRFCCAKDAQ